LPLSYNVYANQTRSFFPRRSPQLPSSGGVVDFLSLLDEDVASFGNFWSFFLIFLFSLLI